MTDGEHGLQRPSPQLLVASGTSQTFLSKRVQSIISNEKLFESIPLDAMVHLSELLKSERPLVGGKTLKSTLESHLLDLHSAFVGTFEAHVASYVRTKLSDMEKVELQLGESVDKLSMSRDQIGTVIERSSAASAELLDVERKAELLSRFHELFAIEELGGRVQSSNLADLLILFEEIQKKRENCQALLHAVPTASIAIHSLSAAAQQLEAVYDRVYFTLLRDESGVTASQLRQSLVLLQDRAHLFHETLVSVCRARCDRLSASFLQVLTKDEDGLELNSFDSVRFVSDMLSWFLDAALLERDWLDGSVVAVRELTWSTPPVTKKQDYIDVSLAGVIEMIDSRFSSIVKSCFGVLELFKLTNIVSFYLRKLDGVSGPATREIGEAMQRSAWAAFIHQWERRVQTERSSALLKVAAGLGPLPVVSETGFLLEQILSIHAELGGEEDEELFSVVSGGVDPLIQLAVQVSSSMSRTESAVFLLNCLEALRSVVSRFDFVAAIAKNLKALMDDQMQQLVSQTQTAVLNKTGLGEKLNEIRKLKTENKLSDLHPIALSSVVKSFYSMLFTQGVSSISHADCLIAKELRAQARLAIGPSIADAYAEFYDAVKSLGVASHSPDQVRALLDL